jgi:hypothetical protein
LSTINIKIDYIKNIVGSVGQGAVRVSNSKSGLSSLRYNVDSDIRSRRNIGARLNSVCNACSELEDKLRRLEKFVNNSTDSYRNAELYLINKVINDSIDGKKPTDSHLKDVMEENTFDETASINGNNGGNKLGWEKAITTGLKGIGNALGLTSAFHILGPGKGINFRMFRHEGNVFIKIISGNIRNQSDFNKYRNLLKDYLGGTAKWKRDFVTDLANEGVPLYNNQTNKYYKSNSNKLRNSQFDNMGKYIDQLGQSKIKVASSTFKSTFKSNIQVWDDFTKWRGATTMTKVGKAAGILGTGLTAYSNFKENMYNQNTGEFDPTPENIKEFLVDTTVDIGTGAAAMATGAALGSLILPPVGTVVGAVAGMGINILINKPLPFGEPPKSLVEHTKDVANDVVNSIEEGVGMVVKSLGKIFF